MPHEELALGSSPGVTAIERAAPTVATMLDTFIQRGVTAENVAAFEKLVEVHERMQAKDAEKQFNSAFVALQSDLPVIVATTVIPNRGKYERFEDVAKVVNPLLVKHGFSVSFSMDVRENRVIETCHLRHTAGHSQSNSFAVRTGKADTDTQADCKAATTAKRNALLNCLNIVIRQDVLQDEEGDATLSGECVDFAQAQYLKEQVKETGTDEAAFLAYAQAKGYDAIPKASYDRLVQLLHKKARK